MLGAVHTNKKDCNIIALSCVHCIALVGREGVTGVKGQDGREKGEDIGKRQAATLEG